MIGFKRLVFMTTIATMVLLTVGIWIAPVRAKNAEMSTLMTTGPLIMQPGGTDMSVSAEEEEIKDVIRSYFDLRYRAISALQLKDFGGLVSNAADAREFLDLERGKLSIEIKHAELNHLRYVNYNYFLDFKNIAFDPLTQTATVSVIEGHDIVYEISKEFNPDNPMISRMRNLEHTIVLRKEQDQWKIVYDDYKDYLWRMLRQTGVSTDEMLRTMGELRSPIQQSASIQANLLCSLPEDDSTHPYYRDGVVNYAHRYAFGRNPNYDDFSGVELGGDCTNFVSQAIYEGGNASMAYPSEQGIGTVGWYYTDINHRASAWTQVTKLHEFITQSWVWTEGPEGCDVSQNQADPGDLIQYDWENDGEWDHSVIIVRSEDDAQGNRMHWVAGHSEDQDDYPFTDYIYNNPNMVYRSIHIERSDGYDTSPTATPTVVPSPTAATPTPTHTPMPTATATPPPPGYFTILGSSVTAQGWLRIDSKSSSCEQFSPYYGVCHFSVSGHTSYTNQGGQFWFNVSYNKSWSGRIYYRSVLWQTAGPAAMQAAPRSWSEWIKLPLDEQSSYCCYSGNRMYKVPIRSQVGYPHGTQWGASGDIYISVYPDFPSGPTPTTTAAGPTPEPTPTPKPCTCITRATGECQPVAARSVSMQSAGLYGTSTPSVSTLMPLSSNEAVDPAERESLLYRLRDEIMRNSVEGQRLITLYYDHSLEIAALMLSNLDLYDQGFEVLDAFLSGLQAMLDGQGDSVTITGERVGAAGAFLDELLTRGSPALQGVIQEERDRRPLEPMIGMSMEQAWNYLNGYQLTWLQPLSNPDPYVAQAGRTIPVQFTLADMQGNFVADQSVRLELTDGGGEALVGPVGLSSNPAQGIVIQAEKYHYNLTTSDLAEGLYTLRVYYNSANPDEPLTLTIQLVAGKK